MKYPVTRRQGVPQPFGSNLLNGPTTLKFTDPVEIRPASPNDVNGVEDGVTAPSSRTDKPYRYLELEVNEGRPSEEAYAPTTPTPSSPTSGRFESPIGDKDTKGGDSREKLTASATSSSRGANSYYDVTDAEKKRRETLRSTPYGSGGTGERTNSQHAYGGFKTSGWTSSRDREPQREHWSEAQSPRPAVFDDPSKPPEETKDVELIESIASELRYLNSKLTALRDRRTKSERDQQYRGDADRYRDSSNRDAYRPASGSRDPEQDRNRIRYESDRDYESYRKDHPLRIREKDPEYRYSQNRYPDADNNAAGPSGSRRPFGRNAFGSGHGFPRELFDSRFYRLFNQNGVYYRGIRDNDYGRTAPRGYPPSAERSPTAPAVNDEYVSEETPDDLASLVPDRRAWDSIVVNRRNLPRKA